MPGFIDRNGNPVQVYGPEADEAFRSGQIGAVGEIEVIGPDGESYNIPAKQLPDAVRGGARFPSLDEIKTSTKQRTYGTGAQQALTAAEGVARSATLGLSDLAMPDVYQRQMAERQDVNPKSAMAGEIGGMLAPTGAAGLVGKTASAAAKAVPRAGTLVRGAVEGGLWGLGEAISEEALGDSELNSEKILAATGGGSLAGVGLNAAGKALKMSGSMLMQSMGGMTFKAKLQEIAEKGAIRSLAQKSHYNKGKLDDDKVIARFGFDRDVKLPGGKVEKIFERGDSPAAMKEKAQLVLEELGAGYDEVLTAADQAKPFDVSQLTARLMKEHLDPLAGRPAKAGAYAKLRNMIEGYQQFGPGGALQGQMTFREAKRQLGDLFIPAGKDAAAHELGPVAEELNKFRKTFKEEIIRQAEVARPDLGKQLKQLDRDFRSANKIAGLAEDFEHRLDGNRQFSMSDHQVGQAVSIGAAAASGDVSMMALGLVGMGANKLMRERGGMFAAVTLDRLARGKTIERMANQFHKLTKKRLENIDAFGAYRGMIEQAAAGGAMSLLETHAALAHTDPNYLAEAGFTDESAEDADSYAVKADNLDRVGAMIDDADKRMDQGIGRMLGTQGGRLPERPERGDRREEFRTKVEKLAELAADPESMADALETGGLLEHAPEIAAAMAAKRSAAAQFLLSKAPQNPNRNYIPALSAPWEPSDVEVDRWFRFADAIEDPMSVLADLRDGSITPEAVEAVQTVYPRLVAEISDRMMERLAGYGKPLTYEQKMALSALFGRQVGEAGDPERLAMLQEIDAVSMQLQAGSPGASSGTNTDQSNWATMDQLLEQRRNQT